MRNLMELPSHTAQGLAHDSDPDPAEVAPFARSGAGIFTSHPVGLLVAVGLLGMVLLGIPESRWFFAGALVLGVLGGGFLWIRHQ